MIEELRRLCSISGVSGREEKIREYILSQVQPFADDIRVDSMGNLLVFKKGSLTPKKRIMFAAHMDEVGLIVTDITSEGYIKFDMAGGIDRRILLGKRVYIGDEAIPGVIGNKAFHLATPEQRKHLPAISEMYIDIGAADKADAQSAVHLGDYIAFSDKVVQFGDGYIKAKAIDDRVGCASMLCMLKKDLPCDCWFAFTVQEEVGCRGAAAAANRICPDVAVILEGTTAADLPGVGNTERVCTVGGGIVLPFMDGSTIYDRELYLQLGEIADRNGIRWQTKTRIAGGTDASVVQRSGAGVKTAAISVAMRNIHSPACIAKTDECESQLKLAELFLAEFAAW